MKSLFANRPPFFLLCKHLSRHMVYISRNFSVRYLVINDVIFYIDKWFDFIWFLVNMQNLKLTFLWYLKSGFSYYDNLKNTLEFNMKNKSIVVSNICLKPSFKLNEKCWILYLPLLNVSISLHISGCIEDKKIWFHCWFQLPHK